MMDMVVTNVIIVILIVGFVLVLSYRNKEIDRLRERLTEHRDTIKKLETQRDSCSRAHISLRERVVVADMHMQRVFDAVQTHPRISNKHKATLAVDSNAATVYLRF